MMIVSKSNKLRNLKKLKLRETYREREIERETATVRIVEKGMRQLQVEFKGDIEFFHISKKRERY